VARSSAKADDVPRVERGVSGYGFDQIVLRAEHLTALHRPTTLIVGVIAGDIQRTEMRRMWWYNKPWFEIGKGRLVLRGVPVPDRTLLPFHTRVWLEQAMILLPPALQHLLGYHARVHGAGTGAQISCLLVERLARLQTEYGVRVVPIAQYDPRAWISRESAQQQHPEIFMVQRT
jgi:hypothetical protein